eukprot:Gb_04874 [translate_table: standard]
MLISVSKATNQASFFMPSIFFAILLYSILDNRLPIPHSMETLPIMHARCNVYGHGVIASQNVPDLVKKIKAPDEPLAETIRKVGAKALQVEAKMEFIYDCIDVRIKDVKEIDFEYQMFFGRVFRSMVLSTQRNPVGESSSLLLGHSGLPLISMTQYSQLLSSLMLVSAWSLPLSPQRHSFMASLPVRFSILEKKNSAGIYPLNIPINSLRFEDELLAHYFIASKSAWHMVLSSVGFSSWHSFSDLATILRHLPATSLDALSLIVFGWQRSSPALIPLLEKHCEEEKNNIFSLIFHDNELQTQRYI